MAWRNGPVKEEGRGCAFAVLKSGYSPTKPNTYIGSHMATKYHPLLESVFYHHSGVCTLV